MYFVPPPKALDPSTDPRYTHKGKFSAWLIKAKSDGAKAKWFQTLGRRYFTIDFDRQVFYYQHGESKHEKASTPIPFRDILGAVSGHCYDHDDQCCPKSRGLTRSFSSTFSRPRQPAPGIFPFTVRTKGKRLHLEAEVESETFHWIAMLNAAHRIGNDVDMLNCSNTLDDDSAAIPRAATPDSLSASSRDGGKPPSITSDEKSTTASQQSTAADGESEESSGPPSPKTVSEAGVSEVVFAVELREDVPTAGGYATAPVFKAPPPSGGMAGPYLRGYLGSGACSAASSQPQSPREAEDGNAAKSLQACDFGFDEDELEGGDEASPQPSPAPSPRAAARIEVQVQPPTLPEEVQEVEVRDDASEDEATPVSRAHQDAHMDATRVAADIMLLQRQLQATASKPKRRSRGNADEQSSTEKASQPKHEDQAARVAADLMLLQAEAAKRSGARVSVRRPQAVLE
eukprot:gb/GFBE01035106.1/.p1 GENE.gb/GFBE01035106.1/~~gb/GFBE01035106.1/.p1  ORF type:complete len:458 (+),score=80.49 gb/GFBE01035106.1/:1-1374(+)